MEDRKSLIAKTKPAFVYKEEYASSTIHVLYSKVNLKNSGRDAY